MSHFTKQSRLLLTAVAVVASASPMLARGQQQGTLPPPAATPTPTPEQVNNQVRMFETSLRAAVEQAARTFTARVREAVPTFNSNLMFLNDPMVTGVVIPDVGVVFHVQIPALLPTDQIIMTNMFDRLARIAPDPARPSPVIPVAERSATVPTVPVTAFEPDKEYTNITRDRLYDAVLDNALSLPIPEGQSLTVFAGELLPPGTNPLAPRSRLLILTIKAEDLLALRKTEITRDQARERIKESRFGG